MKKIFSIFCGLAFISLAALSPVSYAGQGVGSVAQLLVGRNGHEVYVQISGEITGFPCSTSHPNGFQFGFSLTDHEAAKAMLATLTAAQLSRSEIHLQGAGSCASFDNRLENAAYVILKTQ